MMVFMLVVMSFLTCIRFINSDNLISYSFECYKCNDCTTINKKITARCFTMRGCYAYKTTNGELTNSLKTNELGCLPYNGDYCADRRKDHKDTDECTVCYSDLCNGLKLEMSDKRANISKSDIPDYDVSYYEREGRSGKIEERPLQFEDNINDRGRSLGIQTKINRLLFCLLVIL